jgi:hypothetical protein
VILKPIVVTRNVNKGPVGDDFALHLTDERNGAAEAQHADAKKVEQQFRQPAAFCCSCVGHESSPAQDWAAPAAAQRRCVVFKASF